VEAFLCDQAKVLQDSDFFMTEFEEVQDNMSTCNWIPTTALAGCASGRKDRLGGKEEAKEVLCTV
jgi:hypothetical protein